jgi:hypothetical protein
MQGAHSGLAKVAVSCFVGQFCGYINFVLRMKVCAENRHLRQAANRYLQAYPANCKIQQRNKINSCTMQEILIFY